MGLIATVKRLFQPKETFHQSAKFLLAGEQYDLVQDYNFIFASPGSKVTTMAMHAKYHPELEGDGLMCHYHMIQGSCFVRGVHTKNQDLDCLIWTHPWDENENGEEGKNYIKESGLSFESCTSYINTLNKAFYRFIEVFNFNPVTEQLQFDETHYWITKL